MSCGRVVIVAAAMFLVATSATSRDDMVTKVEPTSK